MAATVKKIVLKGDPKKPESAEHIIEFPGGSISVCRTTNNEYWAHIEVNKDEVIPGTGRTDAFGEIVKGRLDYDGSPGGVKEIKNLNKLRHIAIRIKTFKGKGNR
jgi:hypothetical protein